ncbi:efflux RND transporter periplasmic adaptor subunit [Ruegeria pomeroyi]|uniref:Efflux transporter, RND family, MFP subunit n=2 Tax=Ruegeria pomeroyi TaxID=89184 RepID=Q5LT88_RUEPO|nr:efflux RND transporter periplasmic adaptor subunit [Ruegeria pomeroyi]AAV94813.1 efflux transporter, RND family, MFP subunit [Ruegeria pomeroyi DSS-3]NVK95943.1 efflux RND transporter periplasmic adaptor subunit [Ruegeria pomeroyi]NVL00078.1 efflux RND transporter periplasmic adaptor subunit [Ruegeria pomeroyi]QWV08385.1 efflux RND transporter periplasmic adaptor subunit [Ruegeria pomeroyi]
MKMILPALLLCLAALSAVPALAETTARRVTVTEWKTVFAKVEPRDSLPARSRLGGTLQEITVAEGSAVTRGQQIGTTVDEKLELELRAIDAQLSALGSELSNAEAELARGQNLLERGVTTEQNVDALRTRVQVIEGRIGTTSAQRDVLLQRTDEGRILAPISGTVIDVPVTEGSVVLPGEMIAVIGGGGFFLRLAVPERHADFLAEGDSIAIAGIEGAETGTLAKLYPQIENGRVIADVEVAGLSSKFIGRRVLVRLPVGRAEVVAVPPAAVASRMGLDFVRVARPDGSASERVVVIGTPVEAEGEPLVEILSGLKGGEVLVAGHE